MTFPLLLKLPSVAQEQVLLQLDVPDLKRPEWCSIQKPVTNFQVAFDYVQNLFRLPMASYNFTNNNQNLFPQRFGITRCDEVWLITSEDIPVDELKYVLEKMEIRKKLKLYLDGNNDFECDFVKFSMDDLDINRAFWITKKTFLAMDCARIEMQNTRDLPIREFVSQWLSSRNTRFELLKLPWYREQINWNEGLKPMSWNRTLRGRYFKIFGIDTYKKVDCEKGIDFLREDGMLATVVQNRSCFYFIVWHKRFQPEADFLPLDAWI
uniref:FBA_2 domain-containing protein n=1 Tax=Caenorhabditis tropicalis TaxID=1561998 RepID=A0A1I7TKY3_9PELO